MRPRGGLNDCALAIRLRNTCTSRSSTAHTIRLAGASITSRGSFSELRVASSSSRSALRIGTTSTGSAVMRESSASSRDASLTSLIRRSSRVTSCAMIVSNCFCRSGSSMRRNVSIALRIDDSGFLISCATSAANFSIASMRANNACAESESAVASTPTSSRRASSGAGTPPARPCPSRISAAAPASRRIGRAMVSDRYQDSSTVSANASPNNARMEMRTMNRLVSTSRASRVSRMMPTVWRSRSTGSATVTSRRLSLVRRMYGGISRLWPELLRRSSSFTSGCHSNPPAPGVMSTTRGVGVSCGNSVSTLS